MLVVNPSRISCMGLSLALEEGLSLFPCASSLLSDGPNLWFHPSSDLVREKRLYSVKMYGVIGGSVDVKNVVTN